MNDITLTGWALSYRAKEEETGMFPASLCIDLPDCAIFVFLRFFHALAPQEEALATEPEMKKKAWFLPTCVGGTAYWKEKAATDFCTPFGNQ